MMGDEEKEIAVEITCTLCNYLTDCNYVHTKEYGYGCNFEGLCQGQRPLRMLLTEDMIDPVEDD